MYRSRSGDEMQHNTHGFQSVWEDSHPYDWHYADSASSSSRIPIFHQLGHTYQPDVSFTAGPAFDNQLLLIEKEIIRRIYHDLKQNGDDTRAIISLVYNHTLKTRRPNQLENRIRRFGLQINKTKTNPQKEPKVVHSRLKGQPVLVWFDLLRNDQWLDILKRAVLDKWCHEYISRTRTPDVYLSQERMLASVHDYILTFFKCHKGAFSSIVTLDPSGATEQDRIWKYLSDQVWGAGSLARQGEFKAAVMKLRIINEHMETALETASPQMMVRIWRICRYLIGIGDSLKDPSLITRYFLIHFRDLLKKTKGTHTPSFQLFNALSMMTPDSLMYALRIGHLRAMQSFEAVIGTGHPVVLSMWVYYAHQWKLGYMPQNIIIDYYNMALETADKELGQTSDTAISILHDYLYFVYYNVYSGSDGHVYHLAFDLHRRIREVMGNGPFSWNSKTQYFTFASQILARVAHRIDDRVRARGYLEEVIDLFWDSDTECRVRASKLLHQLANWLLEWNETQELLLVQQKEEELKISMEEMLGVNT